MGSLMFTHGQWGRYGRLGDAYLCDSCVHRWHQHSRHHHHRQTRHWHTGRPCRIGTPTSQHRSPLRLHTHTHTHTHTLDPEGGRLVTFGTARMTHYSHLASVPIISARGRCERTSRGILKILRLFVLELWVPTSPIGYHWQERAGHLEARFQGEWVVPVNILIAVERQLNALQLCRWQFLYNETLQQTFRPLLSK